MHESYTLYQAIAFLAYRDDGVAQRYGEKPGVCANGYMQRQEDLRFPTSSGLPGAEMFSGVRDEQQFHALMQQWNDTDKRRWVAAKMRLWDGIMADTVPAFSEDCRVDRDFWLDNDLDSTTAQFFRFRRRDLSELISEAGSPNIEFGGGYISRYFVTDEEKQIAELIDPYIVIYEKSLSQSDPIMHLLEWVIEARRALLIIAPDVSDGALKVLIVNKERHGFKLAAVRVPETGEQLETLLHDIATVTGGTVFNEDLGFRLESSKLRDLGTARKVVIERRRTTILEGGGKKLRQVGAASTAAHRNRVPQFLRIDPEQAADFVSEEAAIHVMRSGATSPLLPQVTPMCHQAMAEAIGNKPGPQPVKRKAIVQQMKQDYSGNSEALRLEKQVVLRSKYRASADTVGRARRIALAELRSNTDRTPITNK